MGNNEQGDLEASRQRKETNEESQGRDARAPLESEEERGELSSTQVQDPGPVKGTAVQSPRIERQIQERNVESRESAHEWTGVPVTAQRKQHV